jgi:hypothetical protein
MTETHGQRTRSSSHDDLRIVDQEESPMPGRRETLMRDYLRNSAARKRSHKETQQRAQSVAATLRHLEQVEQNDKAAKK